MNVFPCLHEDIVRPAFSMNQTFQQMHHMAGEILTHPPTPNLDVVYAIPDTYEEACVLCDRTTEWNSPWKHVMS